MPIVFLACLHQISETNIKIEGQGSLKSTKISKWHKNCIGARVVFARSTRNEISIAWGQTISYTSENDIAPCGDDYRYDLMVLMNVKKCHAEHAEKRQKRVTTLAKLHNASHVMLIYALHPLMLEIGDLVASKLWDLWQFLFFAVKITYTVQGLACSLISIQNRWERVRWLPLWRKTWLCARISAYNEQWWRSALEYTQNILTEMHGNQRQQLNTQSNDPSNVSNKSIYVVLVLYI